MDTRIDTVLFDIDGTLVNSNDSHAQSWVDAFALGGFDVPFEKVRPLIGLGSDKLLPLIGLGLSADEEPGKSLMASRREIFLERYLPSLEAFPGARELVAALHDGRTCIVASSASDEERDPLLRIAGVEDAFEHAMTPDEVAGSKPEPDIVAAALAWSKTSPEQAVMIGDTSYDVEAATRAGVRSIALRCGGSSDADLAGATAIFDTPAALVRALELLDLETILAS